MNQADNNLDILFWQLQNDEGPFKEELSYYRCAMMEVETKFNVLSEEFSMFHDRNPIKSINARLKSPQSLYDKIVRYNLSSSIEAIEEGINDIAGIRVVCSFVDDIYMLRDCLLAQDDVELILEKDYIKKPKENGYRSLHLIIKVPIFLREKKRVMRVEVQLRTIAMDFWAATEHSIRYKKGLSEDVLDKISEELLSCANISELLDKKASNIKHIVEENTKEY